MVLINMELNIIYVVMGSYAAVWAKNVTILRKKNYVSLVKIKTAKKFNFLVVVNSLNNLISLIYSFYIYWI